MNMKKLVVANAFSINMLAETPVSVKFIKIPLEQAQQLAQNNALISVVGHPDTAEVFSTLLKKPVAFNRVNFLWTEDAPLLVGQLKGRLPEGSKTLPENVTIEWFVVTR